MHELSLANSIIEQVSIIATQNNAENIKEIELEIGALAGIEKDSFSFVMDCLKDSAGYKDCNVIIRYKEQYFQCNSCGAILNRCFNGDLCCECNDGFIVLNSL